MLLLVQLFDCCRRERLWVVDRIGEARWKAGLALKCVVVVVGVVVGVGVDVRVVESLFVASLLQV